MHTDTLTRGERVALFATGAGGAFNILLYQLGFGLADATLAQPPFLASTTGAVLFWLRALFAVISFVGFDLTLVVTVQAMRDGRRSWFAWLTVVVAMLSAGGIALDVAGVVDAPVLHATFVVVLGCFMLHLAAPRQLAPAATHDETQLTAELAQAMQDRDAAAQAAETYRELRHAAEAKAAQATADAQELARQLGEARHALTQADAVVIGDAPMPIRELARRLDMAEATVRRKVKGEAA